MIRNLIVRLALPIAVVVSIFGGFAVAEANAGCLSDAGNPPVADVNGDVYAVPTVSCTTNNGVVYELRTYIQSNAGGSYAIDTTARAHQIVNGGAPIPNYWSHWYTDHWDCQAEISPFATRYRVKAVLHNAVKGTYSVTYSLSVPVSSNCR